MFYVVYGNTTLKINLLANTNFLILYKLKLNLKTSKLIRISLRKEKEDRSPKF